jgi:hypothetical protein
VEFQVEENAITLLHEESNDRRPFRREQAAADLESAGGTAKRIGECECLRCAVDIEGD